MNTMQTYGENEEKVLAAGSNIKERDYWLNKLSGEWQKTFFPYDLKAAPGQKEYAEIPFTFPGELSQQLQGLGKGSDNALHIILTAGLVLLLYKYSGVKDIILGTPIYKQDVEGEFINTVLALRSRIGSGMTFKELLMQMRDTVVEAMENQNYPIESLLYQLHVDTAGDGFPLFDVALMLESLQNRSYLDHVKPNILFIFHHAGSLLEGVVEYNTERYKPETVEQFSRHYINLFREMIKGPDTAVSRLSLMTEEEKNRFLANINGSRTGIDTGKCIHQLFEEQAAKTPVAVAACVGGQDDTQGGELLLTYEDLNRRANRAARVLQEKSVGPGAIVAVKADRSPDLLAGILGILKAGGVFLPIDPEYPEERVQYILRDSRASLLLTAEELTEMSADLISIPGENLPLVSVPSDPAYVIYTSGSTGQPKGVMIRHCSMVNYIAWAARTYVRGRSLNFSFFTSISFDLTITSVFTPLVTGNAVVIYGGGVHEVLLIEKILRDDKVGVVKLTPSHLHFVTGRDSSEPSRIKCFIVGGESLPPQVARDAYDAFGGDVEIYNEYGPTEATVGCMIYKFDPDKDKGDSVPVGVANDGNRVYLLDTDKNPVPPGVAGEMFIAGTGLAMGYINRPELTAEKFVGSEITGDRLYRTGDLARWLPDYNIEFLGRIDEQVKLRGFRIEPEEIRGQLTALGQVNDAVVVANTPERGEPYLCAYVVLKTGLQLTVHDLRKKLAQKLPEYMIPGYIVFLEKLPLTPNGKVDRKALPDPKTIVGLDENYVAPANNTEQVVTAVWSEILGVEVSRIGARDNFFELGGNSLNSFKMINRISDRFDVDISMTEFFMEPTVRELAEKISQKTLFDNLECVVKLNAGTADKNIFILHPGTGTVYPYKGLAKLLENVYNVYGVQVKGMFNNAPLPKNKKELYSDYLREIKTVQPNGPYTIGGYCTGVFIGYEMVTLLEELGDKVERLVYFNAFPFISRTKVQFLRLMERFMKRFFRGSTPLARKRALSLLDPASGSGGSEQRKTEPLRDGLEERNLQVRGNMRRVHKSYRARKIVNAPILVIKAQEGEDPRITLKGWRRMTNGDVRIIGSPGSHDSIFNLPHVNKVARIVKKAGRPLTYGEDTAGKEIGWRELLS